MQFAQAHILTFQAAAQVAPNIFLAQQQARNSYAMQVYYAEHAYAAAHNGSFTDDVASLGAYVPLGGEALRCAKSVAVTARGGPASGFTASVTAKGSGRVATVTDDRLLLVRDPHQN